MEELSRQKGVSVIICCYNSSARLEQTLAALSRQEFHSPLSWEIIIIDNASDDNTATTARKIWHHLEHRPNIPFGIHYEQIAGQGYARKKGLSLAAYTYALFCDDDNWLAPDYVQGVYDILSANDTIAACGGTGFPVFEIEKPFWFDTYAEAYAVGSQSITEEDGRLLNLYGAGLAVNLRAIDQLAASGFHPQMMGRTGKKLSSSDDTELTYALVLMGYQLVYAKELCFSHYIPKARLQFSYLQKLFAAFGADGPVRNLYYAHISKRFFHRLVKSWYFHLLLAIVRLVKYLIVPPKKYGRVIYFKWSVSYIRELVYLKKRYPSIIKNIQALYKNTTPPHPVTVHNYHVSTV